MGGCAVAGHVAVIKGAMGCDCFCYEAIKVFIIHVIFWAKKITCCVVTKNACNQSATWTSSYRH